MLMERASSVPLLARGCCGCVRVAGCGRASVRRFCAPTGSWLSINPAHTKLRRATRFARLIVLINVFLSKSLPNTETFDRRDAEGRLLSHERPPTYHVSRAGDLLFSGGDDDSLGGALDERREQVLAVRLGLRLLGLRRAGPRAVRRASR